MPAKNNPEIFDEYECKQNEVKLLSPLYDINNSTYLGLDTLLAFIMVSSDPDLTSFCMAIMKVNLTCCIQS